MIFSAPLRQLQVRSGRETLVSSSEQERALEDRYRAGFEAGQKALSEQLISQRAQLVQIQQGVLSSLKDALPGVIAQCEQALLTLALEAARRVVDSLPITPEMVQANIGRALAEMPGATEYEIALHPEDLKLLQQLELSEQSPEGQGQIKFLPDPSLTRGGCMVHTRFGSLDATREKMFQKLEEAVLC